MSEPVVPSWDTVMDQAVLIGELRGQLTQALARVAELEPKQNGSDVLDPSRVGEKPQPKPVAERAAPLNGPGVGGPQHEVPEPIEKRD